MSERDSPQKTQLPPQEKRALFSVGFYFENLLGGPYLAQSLQGHGGGHGLGVLLVGTGSLRLEVHAVYGDLRGSNEVHSKSRFYFRFFDFDPIYYKWKLLLFFYLGSVSLYFIFLKNI